MANVRFTKNLKRFFPALQEMKVAGKNMREIVNALEQHYPGLQSYLLDDAGALRKHVTIFIGDLQINDRIHLSDKVDDSTNVFIAQALSGG